MSVINAILFYSRHNEKSLKLKKIVDTIGVDLDAVSVDSKEIRDRLLEDDKYCITEIPCVLILYSTGQHKIYMGTQLDGWFNQLLYNVEQLHAHGYDGQSSQTQFGQTQLDSQVQQSQSMAIPQEAFAMTDVGSIIDVPQHSENVPKPLRRRQSQAATAEIQSSLPSPGKPLPIKEETTVDSLLFGDSGMGTHTGQPGGAHSALISEHIKDAAPSIKITSEPQKQPSAVRKDGPPPSEIAKQMAEQRDQLFEQMDQQRPTLG